MARSIHGPRKRRTREHIISDLSVNHVERQILLAGYTAERIIHDYGLDMLISTYSDAGEPDVGLIYTQVKATDNLELVANGRFVSCRIERAHLRIWLLQAFPVILIMYDAIHDRAWWLYIQAAFTGVRRFREVRGSADLKVRIPITNVLNPDAVRRFRQFRERIQDQTQGVIHHE